MRLCEDPLFSPLLDVEGRPLQTPEQQAAYLDALSAILTDWYSCRTTIIPTVNWQRAGAFNEMGERIEGLIWFNDGTGNVLQLTAPPVVAETDTQVVHNPNGDYGPAVQPPDPQDNLRLTDGGLSPRQYQDDESQPFQFYGDKVWRFGDGTQSLPLYEIAGRLSQGAQLDIVSIEAEPLLPAA